MSNDLPGQGRPPFKGAGFVQLRVLDRKPYSHVDEQLDQLDHSDHPPSTAVQKCQIENREEWGTSFCAHFYQVENSNRGPAGSVFW